MAEETKYKGTGRVLRIKIVNLLYLIFIILAFLYIPAEFTDVFKEINYSYKKAEKDNIKLTLF